MLSFRRSALALLAAAGMAAAQPALTTIQDILYRADGTRFNGTVFIVWDAFQAGDTSNIATANLRLPIVNGVLTVQLVPTTTASAGAQYNITYNSQGLNQFTQVWAVPPSSVVLRVRDVLVSQGTVVGPAPVTSPVQISDVVGLVNELAIRPPEGAGYAIGRTAVINTSGQIDGAAGSLSDCVRLDGSSGPCGSTGSSALALFSDGETPGGAINGVNAAFTLAFTPSPLASLDLYRNGLLMKQSVDYTLSGGTITFLTPSIPQSGDILTASYRYGNPGNPLGSLTPAEVICSANGSGTSAATLTLLGTCTMPAGLLGTGDRIEVQFQYNHVGAGTAFTGQIQWAGTTVISRATVATETALVGRIEFGLYSSGQIWDTQSWGNNLAFETGTGTASVDTTQSLTISFQAQMAGTTADSVVLRNFTVIRYPAQTSP